MKKKIFIVGINGFLGLYLTKTYNKEKYILYGSYYNKEEKKQKDLLFYKFLNITDKKNVFAELDEKNPDIEHKLSDAAYSVMWDNDFRPIISLKVFAESRFRNAAERGYSFYRNVEREGVSL